MPSTYVRRDNLLLVPGKSREVFTKQALPDNTICAVTPHNIIGFDRLLVLVWRLDFYGYFRIILLDVQYTMLPADLAALLFELFQHQSIQCLQGQADCPHVTILGIVRECFAGIHSGDVCLVQLSPTHCIECHPLRLDLVQDACSSKVRNCRRPIMCCTRLIVQRGCSIQKMYFYARSDEQQGQEQS